MPNDIEVSHVNQLLKFVNSLQTQEDKTPCKLCNSKFKDVANEKALRGTSHSAIHVWLREQGEDLSYGAVNSHFKNHLYARQENQDIQHLAVKINKWSEVSNNEGLLLNQYVTMLNMEIHGYMAMNQNLTLPLDQRRKNSELILKLQQGVAAFEDQLKKSNAEKRPVEVIISSLDRIIRFKIESNSNPEVKKALEDVIQQLDREVGDISADGQSELENK